MADSMSHADAQTVEQNDWTVPWPDSRVAGVSRVAEAEAYVRTRFYPPLPYEYGALAVLAVDLVNDHDDDSMIDVSELNPQPVGTVDGAISPRALISALKLDHLIEDVDENDGAIPAGYTGPDDYAHLG